MEIKNEEKARKYAIWAIVGMSVIWIILSIMSFIDSGTRVRPTTDQFSFKGQSALRGKQVFQAYNCMDCHTIVGNGAYFAPDLTKIAETAGPAWLKAYLGSPATYPTKAAVNVQLQQLLSAGEDLPKDIDAYLEKYPGAKLRVEERGGVDALMPNLPFKGDEINALIAYLNYTGKINTAGWPAEVIAKKDVVENYSRQLEAKSGLLRNQPVAQSAGVAEGGAQEAAVSGGDLIKDLGCTACHSTDGSKLVGPSFKGLYDSKVTLTTGSVIQAGEDYLKRSILEPNADVVQGYPQGVMPSFQGAVSDEDINAIVDYLKSLK